MRKSILLGGVGLAVLLGAAAITMQPVSVKAADHLDPPDRVGLAIEDPDTPADIADLFAWHTADSLVVIVTYAGPSAPAENQKATYDRDVLYRVRIDTDQDSKSDHDILVRFGTNVAGQWGVMAENVPGENGPVWGSVETAIDGANGSKLWAGLVDDPFFFDSEGFQTTLSTGTLSFTATDFFAGLNVSAIVLEIPLTALADTVWVWADTGRIGEG